jgi:hypothetical protein
VQILIPCLPFKTAMLLVILACVTLSIANPSNPLSLKVKIN